jgi:Zn-dependent protease
MKRQAITLGHILGIPIGLDYSWFLIFGLVTWTLAVGYYPDEFKNWPMAQYWIVGAVTAIMLFVSVLLHELGHSVVSLRYKTPVCRITLFIFGGVAEIGAEPPSARAEFLIAIAGPAVSFALAVFFGLLRPVVAGVAPVLALTKYLTYINGALALFNLVPGFPLDGGRVFRAIVWAVTHNLRRATLIAANLGRGIAYLFIVAGVWQMLSGNFGDGLWIAFIGWFLENAAVAQIQKQMVHDRLAGHSVSQIMNHSYTAIPAETTLQQLVDQHILGKGRRSIVVERGDTAVGLLTLHNIKTIPPPERPTKTAAQAMIPLKDAKSVRRDTELWEALALVGSGWREPTARDEQRSFARYDHSRGRGQFFAHVTRTW